MALKKTQVKESTTEARAMRASLVDVRRQLVEAYPGAGGRPFAGLGGSSDEFQAFSKELTGLRRDLAALETFLVSGR